MNRWKGGSRRAASLLSAALLLTAAESVAPGPDFASWIDGTNAGEPQTQVQRIDDDTFVIRQSVRTNFEAPFLYLLFGSRAALLIDTGAGGLRVRPTIDRLIGNWRRRHAGRRLHLLVAHSHSHGDHHAGDDEFRNRADTKIVGLKPGDVAAAFAIASWPEDIGRYDLGGRTLAIVPTPGHEAAHVMIYDPRTRLMFSGDMLYPGRVYVPVDQIATVRASADRLAAFAATHAIRALLGAHIEMTSTPGRDYPMEAPAHPAERALALRPAAIGELRRAIDTAGSPPQRIPGRDFILYPVPPRPAS